MHIKVIRSRIKLVFRIRIRFIRARRIKMFPNRSKWSPPDQNDPIIQFRIKMIQRRIKMNQCRVKTSWMRNTVVCGPLPTWGASIPLAVPSFPRDSSSSSSSSSIGIPFFCTWQTSAKLNFFFFWCLRNLNGFLRLVSDRFRTVPVPKNFLLIFSKCSLQQLAL